MDPIEISSSSADSEFGTDDDEPEIVDPPATSAISSWRPLSSASTSSTSTTNDKIQGHGEWSRKVPYGASTGNKRPFLSDHQLRIKDPLGSSKGAGFGSSAFVAGQSCNLSQTEEEKHYMKPPERRNLPSSFYGSAARPALNGLRPVEPMSQINNYGGPRYPAVMSVSNGKSLANNDAYMLDESATRILPSSFVHGLGNQSGRYPSPNDFMMSSSLRGEQGDEVPDETGTYQEAVQDIIQPKEEQELPVGLLSVPLLRHQKIALAWMLRKESRSNCVGGILADDQGLGKTISMIALIQMQRHLEELKSKMEEKSNHKAETLTLDDDDDSGSINLDTVNKTEGSVGALDCKKPTSVQKTSYKQRPQAGTLVVCPATILRQWARELDDKVDPQAKIKSLVYHGSDRTKDPLELAQYDVVLTTYAIVSKEVPKQPLDDEDDGEPKAGDKYGLSSDFSQNKKRKNSFSTSKGNKGKKGVASCSFGGNDNTLSKVRWLRVVLDEAQTIKNHRTQAARACCGLRAKKRWCLSGTPIQNTIDELFSYFKFLKYDPYHSYKAFIEAIKAPISRDSEYGYRKLQVILRNVMLRRTKDTRINGKPIIKLPSKHINLESVEFSREEREFYVKLEADSRSQFKAYAAAGTVSQNYANILLMLLRLRQACDHPLLVCGFSSGASNVTASIKILKQLPKDKVVELLHCLEDSSICKLCSDPPEDAVVATCGHIFCDQCLLDYLVGDDHTCPVRRCKVQLGKDVVFSKAALQSCLSNDSKNRFLNSEGNGQSSTMFGDVNSSKIKAAIKILKSFQNPSSDVCIDLDGSSAPGDQAEADVADSDVNVRTETLVPSASQGTTKAIVFSQWTRMLDLFQRAMEQSGITFRRLDGSMSLAARDKAVKEFNTDSEVVVMLMSLKAGNLGLNMVAACHVILLDLWWNPTTEDQAIDRAHRIGQTRAVTVSRLTVKGTVEDRILALQEEKRKMVASAFGEENAGGNSTRLTLEDLRYLFGGVNRT